MQPAESQARAFAPAGSDQEEVADDDGEAQHDLQKKGLALSEPAVVLSSRSTR